MPWGDTDSVYPALYLCLLSIYQIFAMTSFDPRRFTLNQNGNGDQDADWMRVAQKLPRENIHKMRQTLYIPAIPRSFLRTAARAGDSLELLLVALSEMRMRAISEISIGPSIWHQVGSPSKRVRTRLLRQIAGLPSNLCALVPRVGRPHLLVTGPDWPRSRFIQNDFCK